MAKVSEEARKTYLDRVKDYKQEIEQILKREKSVQQLIEREETGSEFKQLALAEERMNLASLFMIMNRVSVELLAVKNEAFLNDARKSCYESVIHLESVVTNFLDVPFSEYEERLAQINDFEENRRYEMIRKLGFTITSVEDEFGENTKWKWSFVDLEGRFAVVMKNLVDFKTLISKLDPRVDGYRERVEFLALLKEWLQRAADRFREKYELSTNRLDDFRRAIDFLGALKRVHSMIGDAGAAETVRKKIDVWKTKMDDDQKRATGKA